MDTDVLIVGAGPTGLALACDLARRGVNFRLLDKAPQYFHGSKGKGLQPRSLEVMDDLGIVDRVIGNGRFHLAFKMWNGATEVGVRDNAAGLEPTPSTPYASVLITPQWRVEESLRDLLEAGGGRVENGVELVGFVQDESGITATLRTANGEESTVRCRYLVAADGGRSFVRKALAVPFEGETWVTERMYVADVHVRGLDRDFWHVWSADRTKPLMLCPLPSTDQYQLQVPMSGDEDVPEPTLELLQQLLAERIGGADVELLDETWMSLYRVNVRMVSQYRVGRVFLAGDAAHVHTPAGGQGMNTGIQDAYNLGWKLAAVLHGAPDELLDTYNDERLPVAAEVLGLSSRLYKSMRAGIGEDERRKTDMRQLAIHYRESVLSVDAKVAELKLAAGDRAPDAPGTAADGSPLRLFDLYRGSHFTLLHLGSASSSEPLSLPDAVRLVQLVSAVPSDAKPNATVFVDAEDHAEEAYGTANGAWVLIRPDGYIGWTGDAGSETELHAYLSRWLGAAA